MAEGFVGVVAVADAPGIRTGALAERARALRPGRGRRRAAAARSPTGQMPLGAAMTCLRMHHPCMFLWCRGTEPGSDAPAPRDLVVADILHPCGEGGHPARMSISNALPSMSRALSVPRMPSASNEIAMASRKLPCPYNRPHV